VSNTRAVVLDNEPVQAILDTRHRKHRRALAIIEAVAARSQRRAGPARLLVPTTVRVEAGWNRRTPAAAVINRLRAEDIPLDTDLADRAAALRSTLGLSVADAHLGAVLASTAGPHTIVTSDVADVQRIVDHLATSTALLPF